MKTISNYIMTVLVAIIGFIAMFGQTAFGQDLPIRSQDQLRQYAMKQCANGSRSIASESIDWLNPANVTYYNTNGTCGEDILRDLFSLKMQYGLINTNDKVRGYVHLYDKNWNSLLFFGYAEYKIGAKPSYNIWMQNIPIGPTNVNSAEIIVLGSDGQSVDTIQLEIRNGQMVFQPWLAGAPNGILVEHLSDGSTVKYDLWNPSPESPTIGSDNSPEYRVEGHYIHRFGMETKNAIVKIMEVYTRPSAYVVLSKSQDVTLDVLGLYYDTNGQNKFERPQSIRIEDIASGISFNMDTIGDGPYIMKNMPAGKYRIIWNWTKFGQPNMIYTSNSGGGGKGI